MIVRDGKGYGEVPDGAGWFGKLTTWVQRKTQFPLGAYQPVYACVWGYWANPNGGRWVKKEAWRGWYYGRTETKPLGAFDERERLIRNGRFFFRIAKPGLIAMSWRWSTKPGARHVDFVAGICRPNGVAGLSFRFQTDASSAVVHDPDQDQNNNKGQPEALNEGWR
jgi:hypothetical protein